VKLTRIIFAMYLIISGNFVFADTITTVDGSNLIGRISMITPVSVTLETSYAGTLTINTDQITKLVTDSEISSRFEDDTVVTGIVEIDDDGLFTIQNETLSMQASLYTLMASWIPGSTPPIQAGYSQTRRWKYSAGADIRGKQGNSVENATSLRTEISLVGDSDELKFYLSMERANNEGIDTSDETIFGSTYVSYFSEVVGWYVNTELEKDRFENIELRATFSGGLSYWLMKQPMHSIEFQTGLGYRHESYLDDTSQDIPIVDINLQHLWQLNSWLRMTNNLSYSPSISDHKDFILEQDSGVNMPIGSTNWSLRLALKNNYKNLPATDIKRLDTTYYSRLMLNFN
jgi:putative salt-induced outer membrane protein YdiY